MTYAVLLTLFYLSLLVLSCSSGTPKPVEEVSFDTADGGQIFAHLYGRGDHGVVLAHGMVFDKESWSPLAEELAAGGLLALAIDFRGYGKSKAGTKGKALEEDILAAVRFLHGRGIQKVSVIGGSMGGGAAAQAAVEAKEGEIDRLILLAPVPIEHPAEMKAKGILFIVGEGDGILPRVRAQFEKAPDPKELVLMKGDAHAQNLFKTDQAEALTRRLVDFLIDAPE